MNTKIKILNLSRHASGYHPHYCLKYRVRGNYEIEHLDIGFDKGYDVSCPDDFRRIRSLCRYFLKNGKLSIQAQNNGYYIYEKPVGLILNEVKNA